MKKCPQCGTQYSDITLFFCLQDGTPLAAAFEADTPTVVLGEIETTPARVNVPISDPNAASWQQSVVTHVASPVAKTGSSTAVAVAATIAGMLLLFAVAGVGAWLYMRNGQTEIAKNPAAPPNSANQNIGANTSQIANTRNSPPVTKQPATPVANTASPPAVDDSQVRSEVSQRINSWKSQAESLNLNEYMAHYAPVVDYYTKPGSSASYVRSDKLRAFSRYSSIRVNLSNLSVTTDASGETATAVFDKEWDFQGNGSSSGKVRQMLRLRKINGQWLITAEKDLKVYYTR